MPSLLPKRKRANAPVPATGLAETVAGISSQIDQLVAIIQDTVSSPSERITAAEVVRSYVDFQSLSSITEIWYTTSALIEFENPAEVRRAGWRLIRSCINHDELNNSAFTAYYSAIVRNSNVEDFDLVLSCLDLLTNSGRHVVGSQAPRQLPSVLIEWIQLLAVRSQELRSNVQAQDIATQWGTSTEEYFYSVMQYTISLLKFKMSIWEPAEIEKLLLVVVAIVRQTSQVVDCKLCCDIIHAVMAFGLVPATVLQPVLEVLCGMAVMVPTLRDTCVSCIHSLSRSHLQNSTFIRLCRILDSPTQDITMSMRAEAAVQLKELATDPKDFSSLMRSETPVASRQSSPTISGTSRSNSDVDLLQRGSSARASSSRSRNLLGDSPSAVPLDMEVPIVEILECYYKTLRDPDTPLRLVLTIFDCFCDLMMNFELLKRVSSTTWIWPMTAEDREVSTDAGMCVTPLDMVNEFSKIYSIKQQTSNATKPPYNPGDADAVADLGKFWAKMVELARFLTDILLDKSLNTSTTQHILLCIRISHFMDTQSCEILLDAVEFLQFCTPGITGWFEHLKEVMTKIYTGRTDKCRAHVLRIVQYVYSLDLNEEADWITNEELVWITKTTFAAVDTADSETLSELLNLYEHKVFYSELSVFELATSQLAAALISPNANTIIALPQRVMDTMIQALAKAFKLYADQTLVLLNQFKDICIKTTTNPDIFARAWAVICRLRANRWDQLMIVDHRVEESYGTDLLSLQEPLPKQLQQIHSVPSLVLKCRNPDTVSAEWPHLFDSLPLIQIMTDTLRSADTAERTFVLILMNAVPFLAHYRVMQSTSSDDYKTVLSLLRVLRDTLTSLVASGGSRIPCRTMTSSRKSACLCVVVHTLTVLLPYDDLYTKPDKDRLIHVLVEAMKQWNLSTSWATHCFTVACYEASSSLQRYLPQIVSRLQLKITSRDSSMYILDFLLSLSLEGSVTNSFNEQDFKRLFGMCFSFIQNTNNLLMFMDKGDITTCWLLRLAYSAICQLFLSMRLESRRSLVPYIVRSLILANGDPTVMDSNSLVVYDMITRFTYSNMPLRAHMDAVPKLDTSWEVRRWLWNLTVLELRCNRTTGESIKIIRRPSGIITVTLSPSVSKAAYDPGNSESGDNYTANFFLLSSQIGLGFSKFVNPNKVIGGSDMAKGTSIANSALSTTTSTATVTAASSTTGIPPGDSATAASGAGTTSAAAQSSGHDIDSQKECGPVLGCSLPMALPDDAATNRAVAAIDRVPIVDFYKIGIIYVAPGQRLESEILANQSGSEAYRRFLNEIGVLIRLKHNRQYYVGGLDTEQDLDGEFALAWSSKISQIIFHTTTMMPNYENDSAFASKKRHIGNNFVNIYFDESGEDFEFDVVRSQFNFINIVITPTYSQSKQKYWKLRAYKKPGMLNTSVAYDIKVISDQNLALFVRNLALKASLYASIHNTGGEYTDNWVYRLQLITTLRERVAKQTQEQKEKQQQLEKQRKEEHDVKSSEEPVSNTFLNDDDYITEPDHDVGTAQNVDNMGDIELLKWMDFTQYTA